VLQRVIQQTSMLIDVCLGRGCHDIDVCQYVAVRQPVAVLEPTSAVACCAPIADPELHEEEAVATAELFRALGDPARIRILHILATQTDSVCGCDLEQPLGLSQPTVSFHLKKLHEAGVLDREKRGVWVYYSLNVEARRRLSDVLRLGRRRTR
jgi:ArsR family transcriptional regulator, arsenate/arsenite/antimonite-responsive transcriptional repressor